MSRNIVAAKRRREGGNVEGGEVGTLWKCKKGRLEVVGCRGMG